jgi:hypothetical protein
MVSREGFPFDSFVASFVVLTRTMKDKQGIGFSSLNYLDSELVPISSMILPPGTKYLRIYFLLSVVIHLEFNFGGQGGIPIRLLRRSGQASHPSTKINENIWIDLDGGQGGIRTPEGRASRFTVYPV